MSREGDETDKDRKAEADSLIDYTRHNFFGAGKETETRKKLNGVNKI